jgi:LemA protein
LQKRRIITQNFKIKLERKIYEEWREKMVNTGLVIGIIIGTIIFIITLFFVSIYNSLIKLKNNIEKSWSNIDVMLKQRNDELTKLMNSVKGYMNHERGVLTKVTQARTSFLNANTITQKAQADNMMTSALKSIFAVAENYPNLKANENFIQFQNRISDIENQLSDKREFYNDSVNTFNIKIEQIPNNIIAGMFNYTRKELFKVSEEERKDVNVVF